MGTEMIVSETIEILGSDKPDALLGFEEKYAYQYATQRLEQACAMDGFDLKSFCTGAAASIHWA